MRAKRKPAIITLTTDFGTSDAYVAEMKGAILGHCPNATLIDVSHEIPPQDIVRASIILERAIAAFPAGTVHVAVVDPGVGTDRRILIAQIRQSWVICPDNGLITWAWRRLGGQKAAQLTWRPRRAISATFHGRDVMGPVAGMLGSGRSISSLGKPIGNPMLLDLEPAAVSGIGKIIYIDHFGNAITNLAGPKNRSATLRIGRKRFGKIRRTYAEAGVGEAIVLVGSSGLIELAVRNGSAAKILDIKLGDPVRMD